MSFMIKLSSSVLSGAVLLGGEGDSFNTASADSTPSAAALYIAIS